LQQRQGPAAGGAGNNFRELLFPEVDSGDDSRKRGAIARPAHRISFRKHCGCSGRWADALAMVRFGRSDVATPSVGDHRSAHTHTHSTLT